MQLNVFLYIVLLPSFPLTGDYPESAPLETFCILVFISEFAPWRTQPGTVGARTGRNQTLKCDLRARSPASWLAKRTPSLAVDAAQAQNSSVVVKTYIDDKLRWCAEEESTPGCNVSGI